MPTPLDMQRTYAIVGTGGCGKTSIAEMLLFNAGAINRMGAIEEGTTCLDYEPEEIKRRGSIQPGTATFSWNKGRQFLVDIPGDGNFTGDLEYLLRGVDSALFVIDAVDGVRPLTKHFWAKIRNDNLPTIIVINKLDRDRADFQMAFESISGLDVKPVALEYPIMEGGKFVGYVNVLGGKGFRFKDGGALEECDVPAALAEEIQLLHDVAVENIAESDENLLEKYLDEGSLSQEELSEGLRRGVMAGTVFPVLVCSSLENKGGRAILEAIDALFPSPLERPDVVDANGGKHKISPDEPVAAFVFKTLADPVSGQLYYLLRVLTGTLSGDMTLQNMTTGEPERMGGLMYVLGKNVTACKEPVGPGAIVAVSKLKGTRTGDTLSDPKAPFKVVKPELPPQLIAFAIAPSKKGEEEKVFSAIQKLTDDDITLRLERDAETGDILLYGMGQLHIELAVERAKRRFKVDVVLNDPKVPYRETVKGKVQVQGRHKKQSGGRGQFGDCWIEMEGAPRGSGYSFEDAIVGGAIPRQYIPAVDKGIQETAARGYIAGYPVVDFRVKLYDGSYHPVDSSEMAFKVAGSLAFKNAMAQLKPVLLEPIVLLTISIPDESMGDVIGDLSSRRGKVIGSDSANGVTELKANVPMSEVLRYAPDLRSMTGGQGFFTMEFDHYEEAPKPVVDKVVAEHNKAKAE